MSTKPKVYLTAPQVRKRYGGISEMGLWRWLHDEKINFPQPDMVVNNRRLWLEDRLDRFDAQQSTRQMEAA